MCSFEEDGWGDARLVGLQPAGSAHTPAVVRFESGEAIFRPRGDEVIAAFVGEFEEFFSHLRADGVAAKILFVCIATAIAEKTCEWVERAGLKRSAENVF